MGLNQQNWLRITWIYYKWGINLSSQGEEKRATYCILKNIGVLGDEEIQCNVLQSWLKYFHEKDTTKIYGVTYNTTAQIDWYLIQYWHYNLLNPFNSNFKTEYLPSLLFIFCCLFVWFNLVCLVRISRMTVIWGLNWM